MTRKFIDYFPEQVANIQQVGRKALELFKSFGYVEIMPSTFAEYEPSGLYENTIKFVDADGSVMILRKEFTPKAAEMAVKYNGKYPIKFCYFGRAYQLFAKEAGELREFYQAGLEHFDVVDDVYADVEVIVLAIESLLRLGFENFTVDIGEVNYFKGIVEAIGLDDGSSEALCKLVDNKDYIGIENFLIKKGLSSKLVDVFGRLTRLYGKWEKIELAYQFAKNEKSKRAAERIREIYTNICKLGYEKFISVDFGMVKHLDYYTGVIFSGYLANVGYPILNGGRYDNLCEKMGKKLYAIGFALKVDVLSSLLKNSKDFPKHAIFFDQDSFTSAVRYALQNKDKYYFYTHPTNYKTALILAKQFGFERITYFSSNSPVVVDLKNGG
ncbi:ATP phosphoribosyltransferase regulatory subunit [Pseudothermotoga thermarum]|uniref:ATP phosphoribosyltransferase regulatory subunit n=1 Tax=Pseudothermotoga thermarum DSM 5069 TaxID=688269 RepID=F7YYR4_9THEM|nr:ATP phosphoribosyltransferase regulatory subunit [Pseudothermotoga thermarum]AEH51102.1 tRNA synthetase class II (G H P and S) [Pseudothermotoga thermarum DSM 5069]